MGFFGFVNFALGLLLCFGLAVSEEATKSTLKASNPQETAGKPEQGDPFDKETIEFHKQVKHSTDTFSFLVIAAIVSSVVISVAAVCGILICFCVGAACFNRQNARRPQGGMTFGPSTAGNVGMYPQYEQPPPPYLQYQAPQNQYGYAGQQQV